MIADQCDSHFIDAVHAIFGEIDRIESSEMGVLVVAGENNCVLMYPDENIWEHSIVTGFREYKKRPGSIETPILYNTVKGVNYEYRTVRHIGPYQMGDAGKGFALIAVNDDRYYINVINLKDGVEPETLCKLVDAFLDQVV